MSDKNLAQRSRHCAAPHGKCHSSCNFPFHQAHIDHASRSPIISSHLPPPSLTLAHVSLSMLWEALTLSRLTECGGARIFAHSNQYCAKLSLSLSLSHPGNLLEAATGGKSHRRHHPLRLPRRGNNVWMLCDNTAHKENLMSSTVCHEEWCVDSARGAKFDKLE